MMMTQDYNITTLRYYDITILRHYDITTLRHSLETICDDIFAESVALWTICDIHFCDQSHITRRCHQSSPREYVMSCIIACLLEKALQTSRGECANALCRNAISHRTFCTLLRIVLSHMPFSICVLISDTFYLLQKDVRF